MESEKLLIGAHTSAAGGVHNALLKGKDLGATTIQLFTSNQKQWNGRSFSNEDLVLWNETLADSEITDIMSHGSYLINLGSNKTELLAKSRKAFQEEIDRCLELGLTYMNFHPGAATGDTDENCLNRIVESLLTFDPLFENSPLRLLIEATAGQGTTMGHRFEHLDYIISRVKGKIPIGVCIDTCHIFAGGYDIRDEAGWESVIEEFDRVVGWEHLYAFHVNDSQHVLGSRKDRHANLGKGEIGIQCFEIMMTHPKLQSIPKYLETPNGELMWKDEIAMLRSFAYISKEN